MFPAGSMYLAAAIHPGAACIWGRHVSGGSIYLGAAGILLAAGIRYARTHKL